MASEGGAVNLIYGGTYPVPSLAFKKGFKKSLCLNHVLICRVFSEK